MQSKSVSCMQWLYVLCLRYCAGIYFLAFPGDRTFTKVLVVFVLVLEILETLSNTHDTIRMFGTDWGNMAVLDEVGWAWFSVPIIGSISAQSSYRLAKYSLIEFINRCSGRPKLFRLADLCYRAQQIHPSNDHSCIPFPCSTSLTLMRA